MTYAIIGTGGKQYKVKEGDTLRVEKLPGDVGAKVEFDCVMMMGGESTKVGIPKLKSAKVTAEIIKQDRDDKVVGYKVRRRNNYRRRNGHRQPFTEVRIKSVKG